MDSTSFSQRCKYLRHLLHTEGMIRLREVMNGNYFKEYHDMLLQSRLLQGKNTNDLIIINVLCKLRSDLDQNIWKVLDCGCGIHGLAPSLNKMMIQGTSKAVKKLESVLVHGVDLDDAIMDCVPTPHENLTFEPIIGDILSTPVDDSKYDMIVFNCSLWEQSNVETLCWAHRNLRLHGHVVIVELKRRLPRTWKDDMIAMGWAVPSEFEDMQFSVMECDPYILSVWQKQSTDELKEGRDLLMVEC